MALVLASQRQDKKRNALVLGKSSTRKRWFGMGRNPTSPTSTTSSQVSSSNHNQLYPARTTDAYTTSNPSYALYGTWKYGENYSPNDYYPSMSANAYASSHTYPQSKYPHYPAYCPKYVQPEQALPSQSPRPLKIISPSGQAKTMIFVERVSHITAQVEYGLVPADPKLRNYDAKTGEMIGNEGMELLSPKVFEDTFRGMFFFAERRPVPTTERGTGEEGEKAVVGEHDRPPIVKSSRRRTMRRFLPESPPKQKRVTAIESIPTLLEQLVKLKVLMIVPTVRCRSVEHSGACLVQILLSDSEVSTHELGQVCH
jgi:hypothetical protein